MNQPKPSIRSHLFKIIVPFQPSPIVSDLLLFFYLNKKVKRSFDNFSLCSESGEIHRFIYQSVIDNKIGSHKFCPYISVDMTEYTLKDEKSIRIRITGLKRIKG